MAHLAGERWRPSTRLFGYSRRVEDDSRTLEALGYRPELDRRMGRFSNFAVGFSIICILSGGVNSVAQGVSAVGGIAIGVGWPLGCALSAFFALAMAQVASAFPTAGGLYHWASILGNRGLGWVTAWLNLIGLVAVLAAIDVGAWGFFVHAFGPQLHVQDTPVAQAVFVVGLGVVQAAVNHFGIRLASFFTDANGYLIVGTALALTLVCLACASSHDVSRLWRFENFGGAPGGDVWPASSSAWHLFGVSLLFPLFTITGYDAAAHTAEETQDAARTVPRSIVSSVFWASLVGWLMLIAFVLCLPSVPDAAAQGWNVFFWTLQQRVPAGLRFALYACIFLAQALCGLATVTSASRMLFAFARDGGMPGSAWVRKVHPAHKTPVAAIWLVTLAALALTLQAKLYATIVSVSVIFLYLSAAVPIGLALFAYGRTWTKMGPFQLGRAFRPLAAAALLSMISIFVLGVQPPNDAALGITGAFFAALALLWLLVERKRFRGPPATPT